MPKCRKKFQENNDWTSVVYVKATLTIGLCMGESLLDTTQKKATITL